MKTNVLNIIFELGNNFKNKSINQEVCLIKLSRKSNGKYINYKGCSNYQGNSKGNT